MNLTLQFYLKVECSGPKHLRRLLEQGVLELLRSQIPVACETILIDLARLSARRMNQCRVSVECLTNLVEYTYYPCNFINKVGSYVELWPS